MQCNGGINSFAYVSSKRPMATLRRTLHGFAICSLAFDSPSTSGCSRPDVASSSSLENLIAPNVGLDQRPCLHVSNDGTGPN